jgi:hypothetical protein
MPKTNANANANANAKDQWPSGKGIEGMIDHPRDRDRE